MHPLMVASVLFERCQATALYDVNSETLYEYWGSNLSSKDPGDKVIMVYKG